MFWAQLRRKISVNQERAEDVLTSNVFGALKYVAFEDGIGPVLAASSGDSQVLQMLIADGGFHATFEFWPWIEEHAGHGCEPDVLIRISSRTATRALVFIEAKFLSGKSSFADPAGRPGTFPQDQLAREWLNCERMATALGAKPFLLFLTAHASLPRDEIEQSQQDLIRCGYDRGHILWMSWQRLCEVLNTKVDMLFDLQELLVEHYMFLFGGFDLRVLMMPWEFAALSQLAPVAFSMSFEQGLTWIFDERPTVEAEKLVWPSGGITWRFE